MDKSERVYAVRAWLGDIHSTVEYASLEKRFWALTNLELVDPNSECVVWLTTKGAYPVFTIMNTPHLAHRVAVRLGLETCAPRAVLPENHIDHMRSQGCIGAGCVNPFHLDVVDRAENMRRTRKADPTRFA